MAEVSYTNAQLTGMPVWMLVCVVSVGNHRSPTVVSLTEALAAERKNLEHNSAENKARREDGGRS